jgi:hypothetical protein
MGWCSATEIADTAIREAEKLVRAALSKARVPNYDNVPQAVLDSTMDELLRPFVRAIAKMLHDSDWDCVEESEYFNRFPQELLDLGDREYEWWLKDQIGDAEAGSEYQLELIERLKDHREKMGANE